MQLIVNTGLHAPARLPPAGPFKAALVLHTPHYDDLNNAGAVLLGAVCKMGKNWGHTDVPTLEGG